VVLAALTGHRDQVDRTGLLGLVVGLLGVALLLGLDVGGGDLGAAGEVGLVAVGYATGALLAARYFRDVSSLALAAVSLALVAVAYAPVAIRQHPAQVPGARVIAAVVALGLICTALAFVAFFELIKEIGSTRATVITYINPAVAVVLGVVFLGESFKAGTGAGFVLILAGSWLATAPRRNASREAEHPAGVRPPPDLKAAEERLGEHR
jgi:drug/metabolite transporter (DMT)-like permease